MHMCVYSICAYVYQTLYTHILYHTILCYVMLYYIILYYIILIFEDECVFTFDTPFSEGGLAVSLKSWQGFASDMVYDMI